MAQPPIPLLTLQKTRYSIETYIIIAITLYHIKSHETTEKLPSAAPASPGCPGPRSCWRVTCGTSTDRPWPSTRGATRRGSSGRWSPPTTGRTQPPSPMLSSLFAVHLRNQRPSGTTSACTSARSAATRDVYSVLSRVSCHRSDISHLIGWSCKLNVELEILTDMKST